MEAQKGGAQSWEYGTGDGGEPHDCPGFESRCHLLPSPQCHCPIARSSSSHTCAAPVTVPSPSSWQRGDSWPPRRGACRHPRISVLPCGTHVLLSLRAAKMPGGVTRAPSWGSVAQPARQGLASRTLRGAAQQTPPAPGPRLVLSLRGLRSSHRSGLDAPPLLPRATGLRTLHGHPGPPAPPERPLWSGRRWGQRPGPVRTRRTSPAWPSSGPPPAACCPARSL